MNQEERNILIEQQVRKAENFLAQAEVMCNMGYWDLAANRYYYSCFHIVQGLFISDEISAHTHAGIITQFSLNYVKPGKVGRQYGSFLARLMQLRQKADYNCVYDITKEEVAEIKALAIDFVNAIRQLIDL